MCNPEIGRHAAFRLCGFEYVESGVLGDEMPCHTKDICKVVVSQVEVHLALPALLQQEQTRKLQERPCLG